jgi:hypothetical protein
VSARSSCARRSLPVVALVASLAPKAAAQQAPSIADENGTPVTITSTHVDTTIYLAKGPVPRHPEVDSFEKIGIAPLTIKLAPGIYTIESDGPTQTMAHETLMIDRWPTTIEVRTGDAAVRTLGTVMVAAGVISIIAGIVVIATFGKGDSSNFDKYTVALPLLGVGAGVAGIGVGFSFWGATTVATSTPPGALPRGAMVNAGVRF